MAQRPTLIRRGLAVASALALTAGLATLSSPALAAGAAPASDDLIVSVDLSGAETAGEGNYIDTPVVDEKLRPGIDNGFKGQCPSSHPYLKRNKAGTYDKMELAPHRTNPGGVRVTIDMWDAIVSTYVDTSTADIVTGVGPSGYGEYYAFKGITGKYTPLGGTAYRIDLLCTTDPWNGTVSSKR